MLLLRLPFDSAQHVTRGGHVQWLELSRLRHYWDEPFKRGLIHLDCTSLVQLGRSRSSSIGQLGRKCHISAAFPIWWTFLQRNEWWWCGSSNNIGPSSKGETNVLPGTNTPPRRSSTTSPMVTIAWVFSIPMPPGKSSPRWWNFILMCMASRSIF